WRAGPRPPGAEPDSDLPANTAFFACDVSLLMTEAGFLIAPGSRFCRVAPLERVTDFSRGKPSIPRPLPPTPRKRREGEKGSGRVFFLPSLWGKESRPQVGRMGGNSPTHKKRSERSLPSPRSG